MNLNSMFESPEGNKGKENEQQENIELTESTFEDDFATLEEAAGEIDELQKEWDRRREYSKLLKEKIDSLDLSEGKEQEIHQKITNWTTEVSQQIINIRENYGIEPSVAEVLTARLARMTSEVNRLEEKLDLGRKELQESLTEQVVVVKNEDFPDAIGLIVRSLQAKFGDYPITAEIVRTLSSVHYEDKDAAAELLERYAEEVRIERENSMEDMTEGEVEALNEKLNRLKYLTDMTEHELQKVESGEEN